MCTNETYVISICTMVLICRNFFRSFFFRYLSSFYLLFRPSTLKLICLSFNDSPDYSSLKFYLITLNILFPQIILDIICIMNIEALNNVDNSFPNMMHNPFMPLFYLSITMFSRILLSLSL